MAIMLKHKHSKKAAEADKPAAGAAAPQAKPGAPAQPGTPAKPAAGPAAKNVATAPAAASKPGPPQPPPEPRNPARILVVDDVALMRSLLAKALAKAGYQVSEARHGQEALRLAARDIPDLIILDIMMPVMSGLECLRGLKTVSRLRDIPVLMCTALREKAQVLEAMQGGAADYIVKPFKIGAVLERVAKHLPPEKRAIDSPAPASSPSPSS